MADLFGFGACRLGELVTICWFSLLELKDAVDGLTPALAASGRDLDNVIIAVNPKARANPIKWCESHESGARRGLSLRQRGIFDKATRVAGLCSAAFLTSQFFQAYYRCNKVLEQNTRSGTI